MLVSFSLTMKLSEMGDFATLVISSLFLWYSFVVSPSRITNFTYRELAGARKITKLYIYFLLFPLLERTRDKLVLNASMSNPTETTRKTNPSILVEKAFLILLSFFCLEFQQTSRNVLCLWKAQVLPMLLTSAVTPGFNYHPTHLVRASSI